MSPRYVGQPVKRPGDPRLITGRGAYVDDLALRRMLHVGFVRSPHAHARIVRVNGETARQAPGVAAVALGPDAARLCRAYRGVLLHYTGMRTGEMRPLAVDRVRYVGEPVA